jgi:hypothetical protein
MYEEILTDEIDQSITAGECSTTKTSGTLLWCLDADDQGWRLRDNAFLWGLDSGGTDQSPWLAQEHTSCDPGILMQKPKIEIQREESSKATLHPIFLPMFV